MPNANIPTHRYIKFHPNIWVREERRWATRKMEKCCAQIYTQLTQQWCCERAQRTLCIMHWSIFRFAIRIKNNNIEISSLLRLFVMHTTHNLLLLLLLGRSFHLNCAYESILRLPAGWEHLKQRDTLVPTRDRRLNNLRFGKLIIARKYVYISSVCYFKKNILMNTLTVRYYKNLKNICEKIRKIITLSNQIWFFEKHF